MEKELAWQKQRRSSSPVCFKGLRARCDARATVCRRRTRLVEVILLTCDWRTTSQQRSSSQRQSVWKGSFSICTISQAVSDTQARDAAAASKRKARVSGTSMLKTDIAKTEREGRESWCRSASEPMFARTESFLRMEERRQFRAADCEVPSLTHMEMRPLLIESRRCSPGRSLNQTLMRLATMCTSSTRSSLLLLICCFTESHWVCVCARAQAEKKYK